MEYQGWSLFDKVLIVAKHLMTWDAETKQTIDTGDWQGYIVDPNNKKMKENAQRWAESRYSKYDENGNFVKYEVVPCTEFLYDNENFVLEFLEAAEGSSQGGKLSFWNCMITAPDGKRFKVGIDSNLLLELIMQSVFDRGRCTSPLCFARCKGGVGMLAKDSESYTQALADMQKKKDVKSKKTTKHQVGHAYTALRAANAYLGDLWLWYEPIYEVESCRHNYSYVYEKLVGFKKLEEPKLYYWFPDLVNFEQDKTYKVSDLQLSYWALSDSKLPARIDSGECIDFDISLEERIDRAWREELGNDLKYYQKFSPSKFDLIGLSASKDHYELPSELREALVAAGYKIVD